MKPTEFCLDEGSGLPVYLQLRDQILLAIARGRLSAGDQLPTVREVAVALTVNPNTVNRAYAELERTGVLATQRGRGTFVTRHDGELSPPQTARLSESAERFVAQARAMGFGTDDILHAVHTELNRPR
jgi:GntR family transcriptional regulator